MKKFIFSLLMFISLLKGVFGQDYWQKTNGPGSEPISSLAINSNGYLFAGTYGKGVFFSTDKGNTWQQTALKNSWVNCLAINSNGFIFAGTDAGGVYRSTDNGSTWTQINKNITWTWIYSFAFNPNGYIFTGTYKGGLYYSTDNGDNWISINTNLSNADIISIIFNSSGDIFIGTDGHSIFRSNNNGLTWKNIGWSGAKTYSFIITPTNKILAGTSDGVYYSTNNGDLWERVFDLNLMSTVIRSLILNSEGKIFAAADGGDFWTSLSGVYSSVDDGNSWKLLKAGLSDIAVYTLAIDKQGFIYAGAKNGFVYRSSTPTNLVDKCKNKLELYYLSQNYPNPFNPKTTIEYSIPEKGNVKLIIYDFLGREIATLVNTEQDAGIYRLRFDASNLSSGIYFYKIETMNYSEIKKMTLIK
ncbi:MAG: T9SS type A sorting domain-containing protein [Melioribacteraceae bacterium]